MLGKCGVVTSGQRYRQLFPIAAIRTGRIQLNSWAATGHQRSLARGLIHGFESSLRMLDREEHITIQTKEILSL
jgi:hypothetical protein